MKFHEDKRPPDYLCSDCARRYPVVTSARPGGYAVHVGECPDCKRTTPLAPAGDYGLVRPRVWG